MKIISIVGVSRSGKTTTGELLTAELKNRGFRVGCCKSIGHPDFSVETGKHDTWRFRKAGADVICMRGKSETDICFPTVLERNEIFTRLDVDWLLLEGDYGARVPAILCAHTEEEAAERKTERTILIAGPVAAGRETVLGLPAVNGLREIGRMADLLEAMVPEAQFPIVSDGTGFSVHGARYGDRSEQIRKKAMENCVAAEHLVLLRVSGKEAGAEDAWEAWRQGSRHEGTERSDASFAGLKRSERPETAETEEDPRRGPKDGEMAGFRLLPYEVGGAFRGYVLHSLRPVPGFSNDLPVLQETEGRLAAIPEVLNTFGCALLLEAVKEGPVWLEEIRPEMKQADAFWRTLQHCLRTGPEMTLVCGSAELAKEWKGDGLCTVLEY